MLDCCLRFLECQAGEFTNELCACRMGPISNYFDHQSVNATEQAADFHIRFTPGVNGDFAFPSAQYTAIIPKSAELNTQEGSFSFTFTDNISDSSTPQATSHFKKDVVIDISSLSGAGALSNIDAVLGGFNIDMACIPGAGLVCNSNGTWTYKFFLSFDACSLFSTTSLNCRLDFQLNRGWTPSKGGGKPLNTRMTFNTTIFYSVIAGSSVLAVGVVVMLTMILLVHMQAHQQLSNRPIRPRFPPRRPSFRDLSSRKPPCKG